MRLTYEIPIATKSTANVRQHWAQKAQRASRERLLAKVAFPRAGIRPLLVVTLTRQAPRLLDDDNWVAAAKSLRDGVADALCIDDRSPLVRWEYRQQQGPATVLITAEATK